MEIMRHHLLVAIRSQERLAQVLRMTGHHCKKLALCFLGVHLGSYGRVFVEKAMSLESNLLQPV